MLAYVCVCVCVWNELEANGRKWELKCRGHGDADRGWYTFPTCAIVLPGSELVEVDGRRVH